MGIFFGLSIIVFCCLIIWRASDGFEHASDFIGRNLSDGVRGATINAIGSSMPELFTTFFFFYYYAYFLGDVSKANDGFAGGIGTTAGSAIFNGMIIPAVVIFAVIFYGLARRIEVSKKVILRDGLALIFAEIILIILLNGPTLYWYHGFALMSIYGIYAVTMFSTMTDKAPEEFDRHRYYSNDGTNALWKNLLQLNLSPLLIKKEINKKNAWFLLISSMLIIGIACFFLVYGCELTGHHLGINTYFVAVILASAATSVPDTILSFKDALKGEYDDAVANALGSNIFDICFALGLPLMVFSLIHGLLQMSPETIDDVTELRVLLLLLTVLAFFVYYFGKKMGRGKATFLVLLYLGFTTFIACKAYEFTWAIEFGDFLRSLIE